MSVCVCECASVRVCECASVRVCECASVRACERVSVCVCERVCRYICCTGALDVVACVWRVAELLRESHLLQVCFRIDTFRVDGLL